MLSTITHAYLQLSIIAQVTIYIAIIYNIGSVEGQLKNRFRTTSFEKVLLNHLFNWLFANAGIIIRANALRPSSLCEFLFVSP